MIRLHRHLLVVLLGIALLFGNVVSVGAEPVSVLLRFAVLGDAEPKPEPVFPGLAAAVRDINKLAARDGVDFVIGVGDIAHKGTTIQYENATAVLRQLEPPFFPIMGNEEHGSTVARFLDYARAWNAGKGEIPGHRYVQDREQVALIYASPDFGRDFSDEGIAWILEEVRAAHPKPVFLVVHSAPVGTFAENPDKGIRHPGFAAVAAQPNLRAVLSGDLHMDMARVVHSKRIGHVHYLHMPALERTKVPDETRHTPMFRVFTLDADGEVLIDTYRTGEPAPLPQHKYRFSLHGP